MILAISILAGIGALCVVCTVAVVGFMLATAYADAKRAQAKRAQKHVDVDTLANAAKRRAQRVWTNVPSSGDEHEINVGI